MSRVIGHKRDVGQGRARITYTIPASGYAPEILYLGATPTGKSEYLHVVQQLQAFIESLPTGASLEVDLLRPDGDPTPDGPWVTVGAARGSNDKRVSTTAFDYWLSNQHYAKAADTVGTALPAGTIPINQWGGFAVYIDSSGTKTILAAPNNFTSGYANTGAADTAAQAIATPAGTVRIARFTVQTKVGFVFVCDTDALTGGASGNVANATNFTNEAAVTGDWYTNIAAAMNSIGLKAAVVTSAWEGVRVRGKSGGTPGSMPVSVVWT